MRVLVINSNTTESVTRAVADEARRSASPDTEIVAVTARFGEPAIETRAHAVVAAHATLDALHEHGQDIDAAVIACFSDPGLLAAKESNPFPVVGIAEAAMMTACLLGSRFAVVTVAPRSVPAIRDLVYTYGLSGRLAGVRAAALGVLESHADPETTRGALASLIDRAVSEDGADSVILGGAVTAGMAESLGVTTSVPILDGVACAVRQAELLVGLRLHVRNLQP